MSTQDLDMATVLQTQFDWLQRMHFAHSDYSLRLSGPAGVPRVPDPKRSDEPLVYVDPDALSLVEPESHYFHDITTIMATTSEYRL